MNDQEQESDAQQRATRIIEQCGNGSSGVFLHRLRLSKLPPEIGHLTELRELLLTNHQLSELPPEIGKLKKLERLSLSDNRLSSLPPEIGKLSALKELYLLRNHLTSLPPEIGGLEHLQELYLWGNKLKKLPKEIGRLRELRILNLSLNQLSKLPVALRKLETLKELYLHGNPALRIPAEVLGPSSGTVFSQKHAPKSPAKILDFYFRERTSLLLESRILVIGDGGVGKTSLVHQLTKGLSAEKNEPSTRDVALERWEIEALNERVQVSMWDFGGQEALHAAHPLFFTKDRTLYLVVASARETHPEERIDYWLKMVARHGQGARALVVVNRVDEHPMDINRRELCARHQDCLPEDVSRAFYATSCLDGSGISQLRDAIRRELEAMEQVWTLIPNDWFKVKEAIAAMHPQNRTKADQQSAELTADTLTLDDWQRVCVEFGVVDIADQRELLDLLRNLGLVVAFPDDPHLSGLGVLNPEWVTRAIYPILTSARIAETGGFMGLDDLRHLLPEERYPLHRHVWLIELMKKCELIFGHENQRFIVPSRLPKDTPDWAHDPRWHTSEVLHLEMRYDVLPENVISRFIVRKHSQARQFGSWWRHGILLIDDGCEALIRANFAKSRIEVFLLGPKTHRRQFLGAIRETLRSVSQNAEGELWVVLNGGHPEKFSDLLELAAEGERQIKRVVNGRAMAFNLVDVLDLIETREQQTAAIQFIQKMENKNETTQITATGSIVNYKSTLNNVQMMLNAAPPAQTPGEDKVRQAIKAFSDKLAAADAKHADGAGFLSQRLEELTKQTTKPPAERKKSFLEMSAKGLKDAAVTVGDIVPGLIETAEKIAEAIAGWFSGS